MNRVERDGLVIWFIDPDDAAISKYARGEPRDERWIRAGLVAGLVSLPRVRSRLKDTSFLNEDELTRVRVAVDADTEWFSKVVNARKRASRKNR